MESAVQDSAQTSERSSLEERLELCLENLSALQAKLDLVSQTLSDLSWQGSTILTILRSEPVEEDY